MKDREERLFTTWGWIGLAALACAYGAVFFGLDRDWVNWAAPLAFGGVLYPAQPAPASIQELLPQHVLPSAYLLNFACLVALALLAEFSCSQRLTWVEWLGNRLHRGAASLLRNHHKSIHSH